MQITVTIETPSSKPPLWRVLHDYEIWKRQPSLPEAHGQIENAKRAWDWRVGDPEVFWLYGSHKVPFTESWQRLSFALNEGIDPKKWRIVFDDHRAFMNNSGFWSDGSPYAYVPRRDYVNGIDLSGEMPSWDKVRVCGGATVSGKVVGEYLEVATLDYFNPPTIDWLRAHPWLYFRAVISGRKTNGSPYVYDFPQNGGHPVWIPLVASYPVKLPLAILESVTDIANPLTVGV